MGRGQILEGFVSILKECRFDPNGSKKPLGDLKQKLTSLARCF